MQIRWTKGAKKNLQQIEAYITQDNPHAAVGIVLSIIQSIEALMNNPAMGRAGRVIDTRELIIPGTPYIVPYRVKEKRIEILRVLHTAMQWPNTL